MTTLTYPDIKCPIWCTDGSNRPRHFMNFGEVSHSREFSSTVSVDQFVYSDGTPQDSPPGVVVIDLSDEMTADEAREHGRP